MKKWIEHNHRVKISLVILLVVLAISAMSYSNYINKNTVHAYRVLFNGEELGLVEDIDGVEDYLDSLRGHLEALEGTKINLVASSKDPSNEGTESEDFVIAGEKNSSNIELTFEPVKGLNLTVSSIDYIKDKINGKVSFEIKAVAIYVNGQEVLFVKDRNTAEEVIDNVIKYFIPTGGNRVLVSHKISEEIKFEEKFVEPNITIHDVDGAVAVLLRGTDEIKTHKVARGESLWTIASKNKMTVNEIKSANPQLKSEVLQIGQELNMIVPKPYLNVETVEEIKYTQNIPFSNQFQRDESMWYWETRIIKRGIPGTKEVKAEVVRVNGTEVERRILSEAVTKEPSVQIVTQGTRRVPDRGTGRFAWPVAGNITSPFGPRRGGFHYGVDIAAPMGTPIYAADSGTVIFSGRQGNYGNLIIIDHGNGFQTYYAHNQSNLVRIGANVEKGQHIGNVGSTGKSTGPHVHFEIRKDGEPTNPMNYFR